MIFLVFVVVTFHTVSFGLWYSVVSWVPTNALEAAGLFEVSLFTHKAIWVIVQKTWNLTCFSRWIHWYLFMTFIIDQIDWIALHTAFMLKDYFCMFLGLKIMLYQHGRLSSHNMRELSRNMELDYRTEKKKTIFN
jgi:hypothetical protein